MHGWPKTLVVSDKVVINFGKYDTAECLRQLRHEIRACQEENLQSKQHKQQQQPQERKKSSVSSIRRLSANSIAPISNGTNTGSGLRNSASKQKQRKSSALLNATVMKWSSDECKEWFVKHELSQSLFEYLEPCSGLVLSQVYEMKCGAPEFFYQTMSKVKEANMSSISLFTFHLSKLFEATSSSSPLPLIATSSSSSLDANKS